ncbi:uncharacterized protein FOMMEDRAFT_171079 [Fomitiporia mediterranea MF3/22]|uniref:uncharacterized protein n=1 Tax=Fomitiporia mediterranea (strain MF3/22) TaxID=694068 RepID=UPI00044096B8|nr:uncharacterized protein FOMMEDRAFT_171079 [Fomitiporia mediterranea MF3/22]EJC98459.1 hypothetical protein FOMMEDRAFT_171079 [Fomitiporia mediterranea MF3/22]
MSAQPLAPYDEYFYSRATNYVAFMGYTILVWDHVISFGDEVRFIWVRSKSPATYLFFVNRYFTPIAFIGNLVAYFSNWDEQVSFLFVSYPSPNVSDVNGRQFVRYEGSCTIIALEVAALMMLLRVWALYKGQNLVIASVILLLALETAIHAWLMTHSEPVPHDYNLPLRPCTMIFDPGLGGWPSLSAWLPLIYDTYVTVLTLYKCMPRVRSSSATYIFRVLMRDGLLYYSVIFLVNLVLAFMIVFAQPPIKNITAQLEQMFTVAMISRITLSLRRSAAAHSMGLVSAEDNAYRFELDGWKATRNDPHFVRQQRSSTICQHISVVPGSDLTSPSNYTSPYSSRPGSSHTDKATHEHIEFAENDGRRSANLGTESIGVLSISPRHSQEAATAMGMATNNGVGARPVDRVAFINDRSRLNEQSAYELRVMRPGRGPWNT